MNRSPVSVLWKKVVSVYAILEPTRFSFIVVITAAVVFLLVPQGVDVLHALGERGGDRQGIGWWRIVGFFAGLTFFGLTNWYWSRFLLNCEFPTGRGRLPLTPEIKYWLRLHVPRLLGTAPVVVIGAGFAIAARQNERDDRGWPDTIHILLAALCLLLAVAMYVAFIVRRRLLAAPLRGTGVPSTGRGPGHQRLRGFTSLRDMAADRGLRIGLALFGLPPFLLLIAFTFAAVPMGLFLGTACVLFFALASWSCFGGIAVYAGHRHQLPILGLLAAFALLASLFNDNHPVRQLAGTDPPRPSLAESLGKWRLEIAARYPNEEKHPMIIVAAEGGGIRAAYWTALVLASLEDASPAKSGQHAFSDHVLAISGVSGGSLGGAVFVSLVSRASGTSLSEDTRRMLHQEFLAPMVGKMLFPDLWQRLLPFPIDAFDRASALEDGWSYAWHHEVDGRSNPFDASLMSLYSESEGRGLRLPALFLNGTEVESGRRIITSNLRFSESGGLFVDAIDGLERMRGAPIRLSTAVHSSARFTYVSPPGRFPDGTHVVDGGYFENSGGHTAHDILRAALRQGWSDVEPIVLVIQNGPEDLPRDAADPAAESGEARNDHAAHEILDPVLTMLHTRTAHADLSLGELCCALGPSGKSPVATYTFGLVARGTSLPLGWALSPGAMAEMDFQLDPEAASNRRMWDKCEPRVRSRLLNSKQRQMVLDLLPR